MPAPSPCPVLNIDRALSSYVHSREETLKIRKTLTKYLAASLRPVNSPSRDQHLSQECPQGVTASSKNPPGLAGLRSEFLHELRNQSAAQTRYRQLQTSLDELQNRHLVESPVEAEPKNDDDTTQSYIALLRQRRGYSELQIIQESLEKLLDVNPINGSQDPKTLVTRAIGEQPSLPAERLDQILATSGDSPFTLKVKKEVIDASSGMERTRSARANAKAASQESPKLEDQIRALGVAREEMIEWVQTELAKIEVESEIIEDASPIKRATHPFSPADLASSESRIQSTYEAYTVSRLAAIKSQVSLQEPIEKEEATGAPQTTIQQTDIDDEKKRLSNVFTKFLPHLPSLMHIDNGERALLQHLIYLQAQINAADDETAEQLSRLAGESHLLPSSAKGVESWGTITAEIEQSNENLVRTSIAESNQEISRISTIVDLCSLQSRVLSSM
ncbi:unnamed protein product [Periconia digitata]|uniref:Uncharacterized protein n=1 Tax=Periconia digitata TaxID=1303443 RepID=A0A9W4UAR7_9PLEO|nr:unnamed protein product [Periconia digitata]